MEKNQYMYIRLFPEPSRGSKEQSPIARFILRVSSNTGHNRRPYIFPRFHSTFHLPNGALVLLGGEACSIWPDGDDTMQSVSSQSTLRCLSRMLDEGIHADVTINTSEGTLKAQKAILSASSPVFRSMFHHDLKEKESSTIYIDDMSSESCVALLSYLYGTIKQEDF
ncbi:BTB/POZ domain-containing protein At1g21780 [Linum grandiflorum]